MRRLALSIGLLFSLALVSAHAGQWAYLADENFTVTTTARGFTTAKISPSGQQQATVANCDLETADVRYYVTGLAATTYYGQYWTSGTSKTFVGHDVLAQFSTILATSTAGAKITCTYAAP